MNLMVDTTFRWVSMTPRGCPVLPDVYWRNARSSGSGSACTGGGERGPRAEAAAGKSGGVARAGIPEPPVRHRLSVEVEVRRVGRERGAPAHHFGERRRRVHLLIGHHDGYSTPTPRGERYARMRATRPPVIRTRSPGDSLNTVLGWPAAAQISCHWRRSSSITVVSGPVDPTGATPPSR